MGRKLARLVPVLFVAGLVLLAACAGQQKATPAPGGGTLAPGVATPAGDRIVIETGEEAGRNFSRPARVEISAGKEYTVEFRNVGQAIHNVAILGTRFRSKAIVEGGKTDTFRVKFDSPGTYKLLCEYHPEAVTELIVK